MAAGEFASGDRWHGTVKPAEKTRISIEINQVKP